MADVITETRRPPQDLDAEMALLGSMLMNRTAIEDAIEIVKGPESFYRDDHQLIWSVVLGMYRDKQPIDLLVMNDELRRQGLLDRVDATYLVRLAESFADTANARHYAGVVQECYRKRLLITHATRCRDDAYNPLTDAREVASEYAQLFSEVGADGASERVRDATDVMYEAPAKWASPGYGSIPSGLQAFDSLVGGLPLGEQVILAARPSVGKTSLSLFMAVSAAMQGRNALFVSVEMHADRIADRLISLGAKRPASTMRKYDTPDERVHHVSCAVQVIGKGRLFISDSLRTDRDITAAARAAIRRHNVKLVVVDYLQLVQASGRRHDSRSREVGAMTEAFKAIAQNTGACVLTLSQLNRVSAATGKAATMSELRDSGEIEQHADVVLMLHRTTPTDGRTVDELDLHIAKNRNGATATLNGVRFNKPLTIFEDTSSGAIGSQDGGVSSRDH